MVHSLWHTSNRPLVIPFMAAVLGPLEQTVQDPVEPLLFFVPVLFSFGRSVGAELQPGSSHLPPPPALTQPSARFPSPGPVRRRCRSGAARVNDDGSRVGDQRHRSPSHHRATKITIITWTVCQVTSLPPLPSSLQRESAGHQVSRNVSNYDRNAAKNFK